MNTKKTILAALMMALGLILPFFTMQIPQIGNMLLPMHIPVLLCGFLCGPAYAAIVGLVLPIFRSYLFGMPMLMPTAVAMSVELLFYGFFSGILYRKLKNKRFGIYLSLIPTMLIGRSSWGIAEIILFHMLGNTFTLTIFMMQAFVKSVPGIVIQLILIPAIVEATKKLYGEEQLK